MLATLAIINLAVAGALINDTAIARAEQEPTAVVVTVDTPAQEAQYISWAAE